MALKEKSTETPLSIETLKKYMENPEVFLAIVLLESTIIGHEKTMKLFREYLGINDRKKLEEIKIKADEITREIILGLKPNITIDEYPDTKDSQLYINSNYL